MERKHEPTAPTAIKRPGPRRTSKGRSQSARMRKNANLSTVIHQSEHLAEIADFNFGGFTGLQFGLVLPAIFAILFLLSGFAPEHLSALPGMLCGAAISLSGMIPFIVSKTFYGFRITQNAIVRIDCSMVGDFETQLPETFQLLVVRVTGAERLMLSAIPAREGPLRRQGTSAIAIPYPSFEMNPAERLAQLTEPEMLAFCSCVSGITRLPCKLVSREEPLVNPAVPNPITARRVLGIVIDRVTLQRGSQIAGESPVAATPKPCGWLTFDTARRSVLYGQAIVLATTSDTMPARTAEILYSDILRIDIQCVKDGKWEEAPDSDNTVCMFEYHLVLVCSRHEPIAFCSIKRYNSRAARDPSALREITWARDFFTNVIRKA